MKENNNHVQCASKVNEYDQEMPQSNCEEETQSTKATQQKEDNYSKATSSWPDDFKNKRTLSNA